MNSFFNFSIATRQKKQRILIVDDSPYNLFVLEEIIKTILKGNTYKIVTALNGKEALDEILKRKNLINGKECRFGFIFLDLHMPIMDGF